MFPTTSRAVSRSATVPILAAKLNLAPVLAEVSGHLKEVEQDIRAQAAAFDPAIVGYVSYACESRGKRIRPCLALLAGAATGEITPGHRNLATIVELIHLASLIHDDIMDKAETRRGVATASAKWGPELAVLLGDCLFAHALKLCTHFETNEIARTIATAANDVCQGEILQTRRQFDLNLPVVEYYRIIRMKTAALFTVSTHLAAVLSGSPREVVEGLRNYGTHLGIAYQIYDDCLDLVGTEEDTGKTLGTDLVKGKYTLPVLIRLANATGADAEAARATLLHGDVDQREAFILSLHTSGAFAESVEGIVRELQAAKTALKPLPASRYKTALEALPSALEQHVQQLVA